MYLYLFHHLLQKSLHVRQVIHQIGDNDVIEGLVRLPFGGLRNVELQIVMSFPSHLDHRQTEINPHASRRLDRRQQISQAAADFEHLHPGRNKEPGVIFNKSVIITSALLRTIGRALLVKRLAI